MPSIQLNLINEQILQREGGGGGGGRRAGQNIRKF